MNKFLLIVCLSALLAVGFLACNGMSPLAHNGDGTFNAADVDCDFSGEYQITVHEEGTSGMVILIVTQTGNNITIQFDTGPCADENRVVEPDMTLTGTVDCDGTFSVFGFWYDGECDMLIEGSFVTLTGTFSNENCWGTTDSWDTSPGDVWWCNW